jgi:lipoprotein-anchoring transpeptidase ErfK/SrfK
MAFAHVLSNRTIRLLVLLPIVACAGMQQAPQSVSANPDPDPPPASGSLRLEIDQNARELYLYEAGERTRTYPVAIGQPTHPTPVGEFTIHQIDWNPDWTPPDSEWAEGESYTPPGHPDNPMGRVRMIYRRPYSIHGTEALQSLGRAASHGSVRMANDDIIVLARLVMEAGGVQRSDAWYDEVVGNPRRMYEVELPNPVPLRIRR